MRLYLRSRRVLPAALLMVALSLAAAMTGSRVLTVLSSADTGKVPYRFVLSLMTAAVAVASTASPAPELDMMDTGPLRRARLAHLAAGLLLGLVLVGAADAPQGAEAVIVAVRAHVVWFALAVVSAAVVAESLCWLLPGIALVLLVWLGMPEGDAASWNWIAAPVHAPTPWLLACLLLAGAIAYALMRTP